MIEYGNSLNNTTQFFFHFYTTHLTLMYSHDANALWRSSDLLIADLFIVFN